MSKHEEAPTVEASSSPNCSAADSYTLIVTGLTLEEAKRMIDSEFGAVIWGRAAVTLTTYPARDIVATISPPND